MSQEVHVVVVLLQNFKDFCFDLTELVDKKICAVNNMLLHDVIGKYLSWSLILEASLHKIY